MRNSKIEREINPNVLILDFILFYFLRTTSSNYFYIPFRNIFSNKININNSLEAYRTSLETIINFYKEKFIQFEIKDFDNRIYIEENLKLNINHIKDFILNENLDNIFDSKETIFNHHKNDIAYDDIFNEYLNIHKDIKSIYSVGFITLLFYYKINKITFLKIKMNEYYHSLKIYDDLFLDIKKEAIELQKAQLLTNIEKCIMENRFQYIGNIIYRNNRININIDIENNFKYILKLFKGNSYLHQPKNTILLEEIDYLKYQLLKDYSNNNLYNRNDGTITLEKEFNNFKENNRKLYNYLAQYFNESDIDLILNSLSQNKFEQLGIRYIDLNYFSVLKKPQIFKFLYFFKILDFYSNEDCIKFDFNTSSGFKNLADLYNINWGDCNDLQKHIKALYDKNSKAYPFSAMNKFVKLCKDIGFESLEFKIP